MSEPTTPNPGSPVAVQLGCTCPVLDNARGIGYLGQAEVFVFNTDCPLHGKGDWKDKG